MSSVMWRYAGLCRAGVSYPYSYGASHLRRESDVRREAAAANGRQNRQSGRGFRLPSGVVCDYLSFEAGGVLQPARVMS